MMNIVDPVRMSIAHGELEAKSFHNIDVDEQGNILNASKDPGGWTTAATRMIHPLSLKVVPPGSYKATPSKAPEHWAKEKSKLSDRYSLRKSPFLYEGKITAHYRLQMNDKKPRRHCQISDPKPWKITGSPKEFGV